MADAKRQSAGNRVATPKLGSQGPGELDAALGKAVGARVKVTTTSSTTLEGILYAADPITNLVAINTANASPSTALNPLASVPGDFHLLSVSRIQSFSIVSLPESTSSSPASPADGASPALPAGLSISRLDLRALKAREEAAIQKVREKDATRGKGVTREAQEIFDGIARTLPVRWHDTSIIVNESVIIKKPYDMDSCSAPKDQQNSLTRVKKVLENERRKIAERKAAANNGAAGGSSGKGITPAPASSKVAVATPLANAGAPRKGG